MSSKDYCIAGRAVAIFCAVGIRWVPIWNGRREGFWMSAVSMILSLYWKFSFVLGGGLAGAVCAGGRVCASCDGVVLGLCN